LCHVFSHRVVVFVLNVNIRKTLRNRVSSTGREHRGGGGEGGRGPVVFHFISFGVLLVLVLVVALLMHCLCFFVLFISSIFKINNDSLHIVEWGRD